MVTDPISVCLTFDVDGDESWRYRHPGDPEQLNLSQLSWGRYAITRGLPRIVALLAELDVHATFFVPGAVADAHPAAIAALNTAGHELGHHGYYHWFPAEISDEAQVDEFQRGRQALTHITGKPPLGYRAPAWQITAITWQLLCANNIVYDSSMMGDDRPYTETIAGHSLLELPVHWWLDDAPHFVATHDYTSALRNPHTVISTWQAEIDSAITERRPTTLCLHPEIIGRPWLFEPFAAFVRQLHANPHITLSRCIDLAGQQQGRPTSRT